MGNTASAIGMALMIWPAVLLMSIVALPFMPYYLVVEGLPGRSGAEFALFLPDGRHLLVAYKSGRNCRLHRAAIDGSLSTALTHGDRFDFDPDLSPDGAQIVFASRTVPHTSNIFIINVDGTGLRALTIGRRDDWAPRFSPDGNHVVFSSLTGKKQADLYVVDADGSNLRQLTDDKKTHDICPQFLSDSATIVFARANWWGHSSPIASSDWHRFDLYSIDIAGGEPRRLTDTCFYSLEGLIVSPYDSRIIAIACNTVTTFACGPGSDLTIDSKKLLCDTYGGPCGDQLGGFSISPDGSRLIFMTYDGDLPEGSHNALHIAPLDTLKATVILESDKGLLSPRFSPDASRIVYRLETHPTGNKTHIEVWTANSDGSEPRRIECPTEDAEPEDNFGDET
ncbi:MAG: PD40 domain-containing protein [Candidatus Hydrogenedentes bacterium]|nr:PD40 domain-containing protein [Candidatus Hydrogenedentota bacterium]